MIQRDFRVQSFIKEKQGAQKREKLQEKAAATWHHILATRLPGKSLEATRTTVSHFSVGPLFNILNCVLNALSTHP